MKSLTSDVIRFFFEKCPEVVIAMKNSNHHYDESKGLLNPYHLEGDVLTHTFMTILQAEMKNMPLEIMYGALFHDFGKSDCREENHDKQRVSFNSHESYSAFKSLKYMKMLNLNKETQLRLFKMIAMHTDLFKLKETNLKEFCEKYKTEIQLIEDLRDLGICDSLGRFTDESISPKESACNEMIRLSKLLIHELKNNIPEVKIHKNKAILLCGLPLSGKSTWIKDFLLKNNDYEVLSRDSIILELSNGLNYNEAFRCVDQDIVDKLFNERLKNLIDNHKNIIFDLTHLSKKARRRITSKLPKSYKKIAQVILCDLETIDNRNIQRNIDEGKFISKEVLNNMIKSFYLPMHDEFDEIYYELSN